MPSNSIATWTESDPSTLKYISISGKPLQKNDFYVNESNFWDRISEHFGRDIISLRSSVWNSHKGKKAKNEL